MVDALATIVIRLSRLQPLLLMVEDLHFADSATLEVIGGIIARATSEKLLLVLSSRNNALLPRGLRDVGALFHLRLGGLDETCAAQLIDDVFNQQPPPQSAVHALIKKRRRRADVFGRVELVFARPDARTTARTIGRPNR